MKRELRTAINKALSDGDYIGAADYILENCITYAKVTKPEDVVQAFSKYKAKSVEHFFIATLDGSHNVIKIHEITKGLINRTIVHPREVFRPAISDNAAAVIIGHNHPSGNFQPSPEDQSITKRLVEAGEIIGIAVLDHIIISRKGFFSFCNAGQI